MVRHSTGYPLIYVEQENIYLKFYHQRKKVPWLVRVTHKYVGASRDKSWLKSLNANEKSFSASFFISSGKLDHFFVKEKEIMCPTMPCSPCLSAVGFYQHCCIVLSEFLMNSPSHLCLTSQHFPSTWWKGKRHRTPFFLTIQAVKLWTVEPHSYLDCSSAALWNQSSQVNKGIINVFIK